MKVFNEYRAHANRTLGTEGEGLWHFSPSELPKALALAFDEEKRPRQQGGGPAYLRFSYDFEWSTPIPPTPSPLRRTSSFAITISGKRVFIQSRLIFPWPAESGISQTLVSAMAHDTPVLLHDAYFKRLIPTKTDGYRTLRLTENYEAFGRSGNTSQ